jgi:hypothetical protein
MEGKLIHPLIITITAGARGSIYPQTNKASTLKSQYTPLVESVVKKNRSRFSHCGSFDHPNLESLNDYMFVFMVYQLKF